MNGWWRFVGDWKKSTANMTTLEKGTLGELLDYYFITEKPLPISVEECFRVASAITQDEQSAVKKCLGQCFRLTEQGHHSDFAEQEIARWRAKSERQSNNAKSGWAHRRGGNGLDLMPAWWRFDDGIRDTFKKLGIKGDPRDNLEITKKLCWDEINRRKDKSGA